MTGNPWDKLSDCNCYVRDLDDAAQFGPRYGAHDPACPLYMPSLGRNDARQDAEYRQRAGVGGLAR